MTPIGCSHDSGGFSPTASIHVDEAEMLSSINSIDRAFNAENALPEEAVVRLDARPAPDNKIKISTELSDQLVANTEDDQNRIVHHVLGHVSHNKAHATSAVVDGMPKYSKFNTWCTSCQKGKMHMLPHAHDLWNERAAHANDV